MAERVFPIAFFLIALMLGGCAETLLYLEQEKIDRTHNPHFFKGSTDSWAGSDILIKSGEESFVLGKNIFKADKALLGHQKTLVPQIDEAEDSETIEPVEPIEPAGHTDRCWGTGPVRRCISKSKFPASWLDISPEDVVHR